MTDKNAILGALSALDTKNPDHWTSNGQPDLKAVKAILGNEDVKRADLVEVAPLFTKERAIAGFAPDAPAAAAPPVVEPVIEPAEEAEDTVDAQADPGPAGKTVVQLQAELAEINVRKNDITREFNEKQLELDAAITAGGAESEPFHLTMAGYKKSQQEAREQRGDNKELVASLGQLGLLKTKAPIDSVLARKTQRGVDRPKFA